MNVLLKTTFFICFIFSSIFIFSSCKNKDNSVLKVYIRSKNNELLGDVKVVIVGNVNSNPPTMEYVDTAVTNSSGYATFDMQPYFDKAGEKQNPTGYFNVIFKKDTKMGEGTTRCRVHITTVETYFFEE